MSTYLGSVKHPSFTNMDKAKMPSESEFQKTIQALYAWNKAGKNGAPPVVGPTVPSISGIPTLDKGTTGSGKNIKLGPTASAIAQGQNPFAQMPNIPQIVPPRVQSIFTQPSTPAPMPAPTANPLSAIIPGL